MPWSIFDLQHGDNVAVTWAEDLLKEIGAPVTPGNVTFVYDWEKSEGGGGRFNPLNQGPVPGDHSLTSSGSQFGGGAADYVSWQAGLTGAADYLKMSNFRRILAYLKGNDPTAARAALWASPWASSHYGYGKTWANVAAPGQGAALPGGSATPVSFNPASPSSWVSSIASALGISNVSDMLQRVGLIALGGVLVIMGLAVMANRDAADVIGIAVPEARAAEAAGTLAKGAA